jgi:putative protease
MGHKVAVVTTRVLKPGAERRLRDLLKLKPDAVLVRNLAALRFLQSTQNEWNVPWIGDFSLNATNHLTVDYLLSKGLDLLSPSYDLNLEQLKALLPQVDVTKIECTVHQYMPSFHMEHCVFAAFLSSGSSMKDCGMVCREHKVELRDTKGVDHPLQADQECRNTMFNGVAQSVASELPDLMACGVRHFRIEALTEDVVTLREKIKGYLGFLQGQLTGRELKDQLGLKEKFGVTEGQWLNNQDYQDRKKL